MRNMADSDLYMQCDEDELEPCQSVTESRGQRLNKVTVVPSVINAQISPQPNGASTDQTSAAFGLPNQAVPLASAPAVTLLPNAVQTGGAAGQTIYFSAQPNSGQPLAGSMNLGTYFLNGQPVSFVTAGQTPQLIAPRMVTPGSAAQQTAPGKVSTMQMPVALTLNSPSNLQSITPAAPGVNARNVTPSNILPATAPGSIIKVIKFMKYPGAPGSAGQVMSSVAQPSQPMSIQNSITHQTPVSILPAGIAQTLMPQMQILAPAPGTASNALKRTSSSSTFCPRCKAVYQKSLPLRGYFCQCSQELIKSIWSLKSHTKNRLRARSKRPPRDTPASSASSKTSQKDVTSCELPEGAPNPRSGDFDEQGRMIMLVEDFFYGQHPGRPADVRYPWEHISMKCHLCSKKLIGNIEMMNHMKHHMERDCRTGEVDCHTVCQHCYRNFSTPFGLQCHVEAVHIQAESSKVCKICECLFESEPLFLNHMKHVHKPGEMPYVCKVCDFRSSFYKDVMNHFTEHHKDTCILLCVYCLKIFRSCGGFQLHYTRHQKKGARNCDKCRLQFCSEKDEWHHKQRFHRTYVKPKQLEGLVPGTRIIIRAYADNTDNRSQFKEPPVEPCPNTTSTPEQSQNVHSKIVPVKKKPVESMVELMVKFESNFNPKEKKYYCMECNHDIPYFSNHFPTYVSCSLCRYCTCCSRAYANHMISVHVPRKSTKKYITLYKPCPKKGRLSCTKCKFNTTIGDSMAKHLANFPKHQASRSTIQEGFSQGYKRFVFIPTNLLRGGKRLNNTGFLHLQVKQVDRSSSIPLLQPSYTITLPASPARMPPLPIQAQPTEKSKVRPIAPKPALHSLTAAQNKVVLYALCCGVPQAAIHFNKPPEEVHSLLLKRQTVVEPSKGKYFLTPQAADKLIQWVYCQREQQLPISEANLLEFMYNHGSRDFSYDSVVDFFLRHDLGLQAFATSSKLPPLHCQQLERSFSSFLKEQVNSQAFSLSSIGSMDELSVFVDMEKLVDSTSMMSAFKLIGTTEPTLDVVFTALADGNLLSVMLFVKSEPPTLDAPSLSDSVILEARPEGFTNEERLQVWMDKVWSPYVNPSSGGKGLLMMDLYKGHTSNEFLAALNRVNTLPGLVPHGCSRRLQPLEVCMGPVLREFMQASWTELVTKAPQELVGAKPADLAIIIARWLTEVLDVLKAEPKHLFRSFDWILSTNESSEEPAELMRSLTEALLASKLQGDKVEEQKVETSSVVSAESWPSPQSSILALKKIFEKDSDVETFHGFEDSEITDL